jgi:succinyl-CoA synthetase beta subunit
MVGPGSEGAQIGVAVKFVTGPYHAFSELDASVIEINPLVVTGSGSSWRSMPKSALTTTRCSGTRMSRALRDEERESTEPRRQARSTTSPDGNIGLWSTARFGDGHDGHHQAAWRQPGQFSDVGGGATRDRVAAAFKLILSDPNVEGMLVNIFGGIMRCDVIAEGVVAAAREVNLHVPLVVRLEGTNVDLGKKILQQSGLPILAAENLADAAQKVVAAVKGAT